MENARTILRGGHRLLNYLEYKIVGEVIPLRLYNRPCINFMSKHFGNDSRLTGVEIGIDRGDNALYILATLNMRKLFLVDPYLAYEGYQDNGWEGKIQGDYDRLLRIATAKLAPYKSRVEFIKHKSDAAVAFIPDGLDIVYIDGNHDYEFVKRDCELYFAKLRAGGVLGGDNYERLFPGVLRAVTELANKYNLTIHGAKWDQSYEWWVVKCNG